MRKIKKINGFLVVKFNDREKREYEGTALGEYGVIDAEVYTGNLDIDRGAMEYDDADTLEVAVELARGLESEEDITDEPPTYTAAVETNESYTEEAVEPAALIEGWTRRLATHEKRVRQDMKKKAELAFEQMETELMAAIKQHPELAGELHDVLERAREKVLADGED